ncbi:MAG: tetratricopeptide repeat protein [Betaproteobacteria bacterium]|nr:MAG: tetratricopeptide repeat protein [Betaproteobacteria bacterium]
MNALKGLLLVGAALALYGASLRYPLVFDDSHLNQYALRTRYAAALESFGQLRWLSDASYWWVQASFGPARQWQRLANVLLHAGTALLIFGFLSRLFAAVLADARSSGLAFFGALWFAVHPVAVYGVAYLMQRSTLLATLFSLAALWCLLEGLLRREGRRSVPWYAGAAAAYVLALWSKEHAVMLPAVAVALALLVRGVSREMLLRSLWWLGALGAIGAIAIVQRRAVIGTAYEPFAADILARLGSDPAAAYPLSIENQANLFLRYLATWIVPWPGWMSVDLRTVFPSRLVGWPHTAGFVAWLAYGLAAGWLLLQRGRLGLAGFGLAFPWLLALTEMASARVQEPFVLYRSYLWMSGLPAILPALAAPLAPRWRAALLGALCLALAGVAHERIGTFANALTLWDDAVRKDTDPRAPYAERAYVSRGMSQLDLARYDAADADFARALEINPRSPDAWLAHGTLALRTRRLPEAVADFDRALALDARYASALHLRCVAKASLGRYADALADCEQALALEPQNDEAWINTGAVQRELGRRKEAAQSYERALAINPRSGPAHNNYGVLLLETGRRDLAVREHFVKACQAGIADACALLKRSPVQRDR